MHETRRTFGRGDKDWNCENVRDCIKVTFRVTGECLSTLGQNQTFFLEDNISIIYCDVCVSYWSKHRSMSESECCASFYMVQQRDMTTC